MDGIEASPSQSTLVAINLSSAERCHHFALDQKAPFRIIVDHDIGKPSSFGFLLAHFGRVARQTLFHDN
jgi:hypothetical protein